MVMGTTSASSRQEVPRRCSRRCFYWVCFGVACTESVTANCLVPTLPAPIKYSQVLCTDAVCADSVVSRCCLSTLPAPRCGLQVQRLGLACAEVCDVNSPWVKEFPVIPSAFFRRPEFPLFLSRWQRELLLICRVALGHSPSGGVKILIKN